MGNSETSCLLILGMVFTIQLLSRAGEETGPPENSNLILKAPIDQWAEGAFEVSALRRGGRTVRVRIGAPRGGLLRLRDPFGGETVSWNRNVRKEGRNYECQLRPGEVLESR